MTSRVNDGDKINFEHRMVDRESQSLCARFY